MQVALLASLHALHDTIEIRRDYQRRNITQEPCRKVGICAAGATKDMLLHVLAIESGRRLARDIGSPDPEVMSPAHCAQLIAEAFKDIPSVKCTITSNLADIQREYPLCHAVTRASLAGNKYFVSYAACKVTTKRVHCSS